MSKYTLHISTLTGALLIVISLSTSYGQTDCRIYRTIIDSIYNQTKKATIAVNQKYPIDPEKYDTTGLIYEKQPFSYFIYLDDEISQVLTPNGFANRFSELDKEYRLKSRQYVSSTLRNIASSKFQGSDYCIKIIKKEDSIDYEKWEYCELTGKVPIKRYSLSNILYASDKKIALVRLRLSMNPKNGMVQLWGIVLKQTGDTWKIVKILRDYNH
ncbi:hypothetical protein [Pedobacter nutrimenti]|uniref:hypothetical protein n=1 Tax=Pedobacter nutrimenti TaxID=1241337 RepID=UPI00292FC42E|nr:hypothetical protein [Pedobacter nutrimenti]